MIPTGVGCIICRIVYHHRYLSLVISTSLEYSQEESLTLSIDQAIVHPLVPSRGPLEFLSRRHASIRTYLVDPALQTTDLIIWYVDPPCRDKGAHAPSRVVSLFRIVSEEDVHELPEYRSRASNTNVGRVASTHNGDKNYQRHNHEMRRQEGFAKFRVNSNGYKNHPPQQEMDCWSTPTRTTRPRGIM